MNNRRGENVIYQSQARTLFEIFNEEASDLVPQKLP